MDKQLFGFPHSSKYLLTDVNVCGAVQYIDMAPPELQLIECVLLHDTTIFLHIVHIAQTGPLGHFSVGPQGAGARHWMVKCVLFNVIDPSLNLPSAKLFITFKISYRIRKAFIFYNN